MGAKKKVEKPPCNVCLEAPQIVMGICEDCDSSWEKALGERVGTIEWASNRARLFEAKRLKKAVKKAGKK